MSQQLFNELKQELLGAPDSELDRSMKPLIEKWSDPPKATEVLEVLDKCIHSSLASGFVVTLLEVILDIKMKEENVTYEEVVAQATWRT